MYRLILLLYNYFYYLYYGNTIKSLVIIGLIYIYLYQKLIDRYCYTTYIIYYLLNDNIEGQSVIYNIIYRISILFIYKYTYLFIKFLIKLLIIKYS